MSQFFSYKSVRPHLRHFPACSALLFPMSTQPRYASAFLKNVCGQFLSHQSFAFSLSISLSLCLSFFSCFPTSPLEFPLSSSRSVITILICRRILFVPFLSVSSFFSPPSLFRAYSPDVEWLSEGHSSPRSSNFLGQFRLSPSATTDASIKVSQARFLGVVT